MATTETDVNRTEVNRNVEDEARRYAARDLEDGEPRALEREIDATRADMRATLEALERRMSFDRLLDVAVGRVRERGGEFAGNLTDAAARNPLPLLLTGVGIAWLMLGGRGARREYGAYDSYDRYDDSNDVREPGRMSGMVEGARDRMAGASDSVHSAAQSTRDTLHNAADSARNRLHATRDTLHHAAESSREALRNATRSSRETFEHTAESLRGVATSTREHYVQARQRMGHVLEEQPLILGALGLAAGAIIGALLPATEQENRMLGETRDKALKEVARTSRARFEAVKEQATERFQAVKEQATELIRENVSLGASPSGSGPEGASQQERPTASRPH